MKATKLLSTLANGSKPERQKAAARLRTSPGLNALGIVGEILHGFVWVTSGEIIGARVTTATGSVNLTAEQFTENFAGNSMPILNPAWIQFHVPTGTTDTKNDVIE